MKYKIKCRTYNVVFILFFIDINDVNSFFFLIKFIGYIFSSGVSCKAFYVLRHR